MNRRAFTLIELLAVIVIIGILAAITIPIVGKVRESAKAAQCVSNLRQIGMAFIAYCSDNKDRVPHQPGGTPGPSGDSTYWEVLGPYAGWTKPMRADVTAAAGTVMHCPAHIESPGAFSYRANHMIFVPEASGTLLTSQIDTPPFRVLFFECHTGMAWPPAGHPGSGYGKAPFPNGNNPSHGNNYNWLFADGHVKAGKYTIVSDWALHWWSAWPNPPVRP
jgi:prepilin-type N-terminal cleavage/methylation domain-containing protein/prepilin-type processing-associated H-X9-DG protein